MNSWRLAGTIALMTLTFACKDPHQMVAEQTAVKDEQFSPQQKRAMEEVRQFLGQKMSMEAKARTGLEVRVIDDWALARDGKGLTFLCRRQVSGWTLVSSGTEVEMPAEAPGGLSIE